MAESEKDIKVFPDTYKPKISPGMRLFWAGFIASGGAFLFEFVGFCSPYWYQSWRRVHSPLANVGLWHICLSGYIKPKDPTLQSYVGCWWIHSSFFSDVQDFIMPPWFRACQALVIFTLLCNLGSLFLCVTYVVTKWRVKIYREREKYVRVHIINAVLNFAAAFFVFIVSLGFAEMVRQENYFPRQWINYLSWSYNSFFVFIVSLVFAEMARQENYFPRPWMNYLSWSYGCNVVSGFFSAFTGICLFIMAMIVKHRLFTAPGEPVKEFHEGAARQGSAEIITVHGLSQANKEKEESSV